MELLRKLIKIDEVKLLKDKQVKQNILNHQIYLNRYKNANKQMFAFKRRDIL